MDVLVTVLYVVVGIVALLFAITWIILPFLVIGIQNRLDKLLTKTSDLEQGISAANHELKRMNSYFAKLLIQGQE